MINQQLLDFIKKQTEQGINKDIITKELLSNGWPLGDIEEGFKMTNTDKQIPIAVPLSEKTEKKKKKWIKLLLIIIAILIIIPFGIFILNKLEQLSPSGSLIEIVRKISSPSSVNNFDYSTNQLNTKVPLSCDIKEIKNVNLEEDFILCPGQTAVLSGTSFKVLYKGTVGMFMFEVGYIPTPEISITENDKPYDGKISHYSVPLYRSIVHDDNTSSFIIQDDFAKCKLKGDYCWADLSEQRREDSICEFSQIKENCYDNLAQRSHGEKDYLCEKAIMINSKYCIQNKILKKTLEDMNPSTCENFTGYEQQKCFALLAKESGLLSKYCDSISDINIKKTCSDAIHVFSDAEIRAY